MSKQTNAYEAQLTAMRTVMEALESLDENARKSVLAWVNGQLGLQQLAPHGPAPEKHLTQKREGTVSVVAQKTGAKSARDLLLAAAAHLTLFQGKDKFTRAELIACAREARSWKAGYGNQIPINIKRMNDAGVFLEKSKDVFSLSDMALADVEAKL